MVERPDKVDARQAGDGVQAVMGRAVEAAFRVASGSKLFPCIIS